MFVSEDDRDGCIFFLPDLNVINSHSLLSTESFYTCIWASFTVVPYSFYHTFCKFHQLIIKIQYPHNIYHVSYLQTNDHLGISIVSTTLQYVLSFLIFPFPEDSLVFIYIHPHRYASITAIESKSPSANQQWLTYWVLYSLITLTELTFARFLQWSVK